MELSLELEIARFLSALLKIVFTSFVIERSLSIVFETKAFIERSQSSPHLRIYIVVTYSFLLCHFSNLKLLEYIGVDYETTSKLSWIYIAFVNLLTALLISGGAKASLKLMRDVLKIRSFYEDIRLANPVDGNISNSDLSQKVAEYGEVQFELLALRMDTYTERTKKRKNN
jgi:hypothetical protein